jgi:hypothetical protein
VSQTALCQTGIILLEGLGMGMGSRLGKTKWQETCSGWDAESTVITAEKTNAPRSLDIFRYL